MSQNNSTIENRREFIKNVLSSFEAYKKASKQYKQSITSGSINDINLIIDSVVDILDSKNPSPIILLNAIRIIKDCMDTKNEIMLNSLYKSKIIEKMNSIALFEAGNNNEDRGETLFGLDVDEQVSVIGNSLLRLVLECFMFWPIMFESDKNNNNNNIISSYFDEQTQQGVVFPQNINYFKQFYKQLQSNPNQNNNNTNQSIPNTSNNNKTNESNKQKTYESNSNQQITSEGNNNSKQSSPTKKKKKKELNLKALEDRIKEENIKMKRLIESISKLLLVPTYLQLNNASLKECIEELKISSELANTIFQVLEDVQDCINVDLLSDYIQLNEKSDAILIDYSSFISNHMKFDDFSLKYGIPPTSTNEIKLIQDNNDKDIQENQHKQNKQQQLVQEQNQEQYQMDKEYNQQEQEQLVIEDIDFNGDTPAYKQVDLKENLKKISRHSSNRQSLDFTKKGQEILINNNNMNNNINNNNDYEQYDVPTLKSKNSQFLQSDNNNNNNNSNNQDKLVMNNNEQKIINSSNNNISNSEKQIQNNNNNNNQIIKQNSSQNNINNNDQQQIQNNDKTKESNNQIKSQNQLQNQNINENNNKQQTQSNNIQKDKVQNNDQSNKNNNNQNEEDQFDDEEEEYEYEDLTPKSQQTQQNNIKNNLQQQNNNQKYEQPIESKQPQTIVNDNNKPIKQNQTNTNNTQLQQQQPQQQQTQQQQQQPSENKKNQHSIYHEDDIPELKNIQTLQTEQSQNNLNYINNEINNNKRNNQQDQQLIKSYNSRQSLQNNNNNSMQGSGQYDSRGRAASFKSLFDDPVHISIMQQNYRHGSIPRVPLKSDEQNNSMMMQQNKQSNASNSQERDNYRSNNNIEERLQKTIEELNDRKQQIEQLQKTKIEQENRIKQLEEMQIERLQDIQQNNENIKELEYKLHEMNDILQQRDIILEQNQRQFINLQYRYDQINNQYQELQNKYTELENEIYEKNQELTYLKLTENEPNNENLLNQNDINNNNNSVNSYHNIQMNQLKAIINQKELEINQLKTLNIDYEEQINILESSNLEKDQQIHFLNQEIQSLQNNNNQQQYQQNQFDKLQKELENKNDIINSQNDILKQKESAIQDLIQKNALLKENQILLEDQMNYEIDSYKKSLKILSDSKKQNNNNNNNSKEQNLIKENQELNNIISSDKQLIQQLQEQIQKLEQQNQQHQQQLQQQKIDEQQYQSQRNKPKEQQQQIQENDDLNENQSYRTTTREHLEKIQQDNIRVSLELKQQKDYLTLQQQQIQDLTMIITTLKNDNINMAQQLQQSQLLIETTTQKSNKKNKHAGDNSNNTNRQLFNGDQGNNKNSQNTLNNNQNMMNNQVNKKMNSHYETFGQKQLQEINLKDQNTEEEEYEQEINIENDEVHIFALDKNTFPQFNNEFIPNSTTNQNNNQQQKYFKSPIKQQQQQQQSLQQQQINQYINPNSNDDLEQENIYNGGLNQNDSSSNLISIRDKDLQIKSNSNNNNNNNIIQYSSNNVLTDENNNSNNNIITQNSTNKQIMKDRQRILVTNLMDESYNIQQNKQQISNSSQILSSNKSNQQQQQQQQENLYEIRLENQQTPKAPSVRPSFVREVSSPRRKSIKQTTQNIQPKNLGYMSFNSNEYPQNKLNLESNRILSNQQQQILQQQQNQQPQQPQSHSNNNNNIYYNNLQQYQLEQTSTIQSGQGTIYYSNNNTIEQNENILSQRNDFQNTNLLRSTPVRDNKDKSNRLSKLQSLSDYLKTQSKKKTIDLHSTLPQNGGGIKIQTADFEHSIRSNESKLNSLIHELNNPDLNNNNNNNTKDKIKLEDYYNENDDEDDSETQSQIEQSNLYQTNNPNKDIIDENDKERIQQQRTIMDDFQSKQTQYTDQQQETQLQQQQNKQFYKQIIYPIEVDKYYEQKSIENNNSKIQYHTIQTIQYQEELFNNVKILSDENLLRFKKSCLSDKTLLFENDSIKIGLTHHQHIFQGKQFLKLQLYIFNKDLIKHIPYFNLNYLINQDISVWTKPEKLCGEIKIHKHFKQDLIIDLNSIPYEFLTAHFQIELEGDDNSRILSEYFLMIPTSLNRFIQMNISNINIFKNRWEMNKMNSIQTDEFEYNIKIIKNPSSLLKYFINTIELNPHRKEEYDAGLADYKIGGIFSFFHLDTVQFLIKFYLKPFNKIVIAITPTDGNVIQDDQIQSIQYLLQTFYFLFK